VTVAGLNKARKWAYLVYTTVYPLAADKVEHRDERPVGMGGFISMFVYGDGGRVPSYYVRHVRALFV